MTIALQLSEQLSGYFQITFFRVEKMSTALKNVVLNMLRDSSGMKHQEIVEKVLKSGFSSRSKNLSKEIYQIVISLVKEGNIRRVQDEHLIRRYEMSQECANLIAN